MASAGITCMTPHRGPSKRASARAFVSISWRSKACNLSRYHAKYVQAIIVHCSLLQLTSHLPAAVEKINLGDVV